MNDVIYVAVKLFGLFIAGGSQILLKKAALRSYERWYLQYLNFLVIAAYGLLVISTLCSTFALRRLPLSLGPVWNAVEHVFVVALSVLLLRERLSRKKLIGIIIIIIGTIVFCI